MTLNLTNSPHEVTRHRVAVGVQRHDTVSGHDASQVFRGTERGSSTHRGEAFAFPFEALAGGFAQGSHEPDIGHRLQPTLQMAVEHRRPARALCLT